MGGILSHLLSVYSIGELKEKPRDESQLFHFLILNLAIILLNYVGIGELSTGLIGFEKFHQIGREMEEMFEDKQANCKKEKEEEIRQAFLKSIPYHHYLCSGIRLNLFEKLSCYLIDLLLKRGTKQFFLCFNTPERLWEEITPTNPVDEHIPTLFYFIPEYYFSTIASIIRCFLRICPNKLDFLWSKVKPMPSRFPSDELLDGFLTSVINHLHDKKIPNPDQQEAFLTRLNLLLQYKEIVGRMENHALGKTVLLPTFLQCFDKTSFHALSKNFLRLMKKDLYNDINYTVLPEASSIFFRKQFVELCYKDDKLRETFLHSFLNSLNDNLSQLKLHYAQSNNMTLPSDERKNHRRDSRSTYSIFYEMLRVLETTVSLITPVFSASETIFKQRASDLCMLVVKEGIEGQIGKFLSEIPKEEKNRTEVVPMLLSPIAGILLSISINKESAEDFLINADGYNLKLMLQFIEVLKPASIINGSNNIKIYFTLKSLINSLDAYLKKHSPKKEEKISEELLCSICFTNPFDTEMVPCGHKICRKCLTLHLLSNPRCPFCNTEITSQK